MNLQKEIEQLIDEIKEKEDLIDELEKERCQECEGYGYIEEYHDPFLTCPSCHGTGRSNE